MSSPVPSQKMEGLHEEIKSSSESGSAVPDWETIHEQIDCPLCHYNLRGLTRPTCPECGYTFQWKEVLDPRLRKHPYLFEHHPERNVGSFCRTVIGGLNPFSFWEKLNPTQAVDTRRLTVYRWICKGIVSLPLMVAAVWLLMLSVNWKVNDWPRWRLPWVIDAFDANPTSILAIVIEPMLWARLYVLVMIFTLCFLILPELSSSALLIYRASMRQAKIDRRHVDRCVAYSYDFVIWPVSGILLLAGLALYWPFRSTSWQIGVLAWSLLLLLPGVWLIMSIRLAIAYRKYLRMRHAVTAVLAAQLIVLLILAIALHYISNLLGQI